MPGVVHVICASLRPDADASAIDHALDLAGAMSDAEGARRVLVGRSGRALAAVTWLDDRNALEPFAASPAHMAFIMRGLAPCIQGMWSAAVESDTPPPEEASALWVFALRDSESLYEWQVRDLIRALEALPGTVAAGPTVEERERYRAGGVVCIARRDLDAFRTAFAAAQSSWAEVAPALTHETVELAGHPSDQP